MSKSSTPLLLAAGAALLLLGSKKRRKSRGFAVAPTQAIYVPERADVEPSPTPEELPSVTEEIPDQKIGQMLLELGYQGYNAPSILEFQKDWNEMMRWLWEYNPNIDESTPTYGMIAVDGKWGTNTESRAVRALKNVPPGGILVAIGDKTIEVYSFRDMVHKVWEYAKQPSP